MLRIKLTQLPLLNSIVIKQSGGHYFIATQDSIIIDKEGLLELIWQLSKVGFITLEEIIERHINENEQNSSNSG